MEIYVDFPTWEWTAVLRSEKLVFDCILIMESGNFLYWCVVPSWRREGIQK